MNRKRTAPNHFGFLLIQDFFLPYDACTASIVHHAYIEHPLVETINTMVATEMDLPRPSLFLKKPERVEGLELILLLSLLLWRLVERDLKLYVKETDTPLPGWKKQPTRNPTALMMSTKYLSILVIAIGKKRKSAKPLTKIQL